MSSAVRNYSHLKKLCVSLGAELFGVADVGAVKRDFRMSRDILERVDKAVCLGVGLSDLVLREIDKEPTKLYFHHYKTANMFLDQMAFVVSRWVRQEGFGAVPVPASQIIDWDTQHAHLSHKKIGELAGLGWIGRNNLLVTEKFGSQFRMATVLTDMDLKVDRPLARGCGTCVRCVKACPVAAIQKSPLDFKHRACFEKLKEFQRQNIVGQFICGVCVKACGPKISEEGYYG